MSVFTFIAANHQMPEVTINKDYPLHIDIDKGTIFDGDADDNFSLHVFESVRDYTEKDYGVCLEWAYYTEGRARLIRDYIRNILKHTDCVELWRVWLMDYCEYDKRHIKRTQSIAIDELTVDDIKEIDSADIWNNPDRGRPSYYCLRITR